MLSTCKRDRPNITAGRVGRPDASELRPLEVVAVLGGEQAPPRCLVYFLVIPAPPQQRDGQQGGNCTGTGSTLIEQAVDQFASNSEGSGKGLPGRGAEEKSPFRCVQTACRAGQQVELPGRRTIGVVKVGQMVAHSVHLVGINALALHLYDTVLFNACASQRQDSVEAGVWGSRLSHLVPRRFWVPASTTHCRPPT